MILRREGYPQPYELLKSITRGKGHMNESDYAFMIEKLHSELQLDDQTYESLKQLSPTNYIGLSTYLAENIKNFLS